VRPPAYIQASGAPLAAEGLLWQHKERQRFFESVVITQMTSLHALLAGALAIDQ